MFLRILRGKKGLSLVETMVMVVLVSGMAYASSRLYSDTVKIFHHIQQTKDFVGIRSTLTAMFNALPADDKYDLVHPNPNDKINHNACSETFAGINVAGPVSTNGAIIRQRRLANATAEIFLEMGDRIGDLQVTKMDLDILLAVAAPAPAPATPRMALARLVVRVDKYGFLPPEQQKKLIVGHEFKEEVFYINLCADATTSIVQGCPLLDLDLTSLAGVCPD